MRLLPVAFAALLISAAPLMAQTKVAVANPVEILKGLKETKEINTLMEAEQGSVQSEQKARIDKLNALKTQRDQVKTESPQWADLNKQFVSLRSESQAWEEQVKADLSRKFRDQAKKMNEKITKAIDDVAKEKGVDLVLAEQKPEISDAQMEQLNPQQIMNILFSARTVLYKSDAMNITQDVINKLDAAYKPSK